MYIATRTLNRKIENNMTFEKDRLWLTWFLTSVSHCFIYQYLTFFLKYDSFTSRLNIITALIEGYLRDSYSFCIQQCFL